MRAIRLHAPGGIDGLALDEVDTPAPGDGEVLVRVHAAAITRDELDWPTDRLPAIPSYEVSGVVEAVGSGAGLEVGDEVFGLTPFDRDGVAAELRRCPGGCARAEAAEPRPHRKRGSAHAGAHRLAGALRPREARGRPAGADPRRDRRGRARRDAARALEGSARDRNREWGGGRRDLRPLGGAVRGGDRAGRPRVRHGWRRHATALAGAFSPRAGGSSPSPRSRPRAPAPTSSSSRPALSSRRSHGSPTAGRSRSRSTRSSTSPKRAPRLSGLRSRGSMARLCFAFPDNKGRET